MSLPARVAWVAFGGSALLLLNVEPMTLAVQRHRAVHRCRAPVNLASRLIGYHNRQRQGSLSRVELISRPAAHLAGSSTGRHEGNGDG